VTTQRATGSAGADAVAAGGRATPGAALGGSDFSGWQQLSDFPLEQLTIAPDGLRVCATSAENGDLLRYTGNLDGPPGADPWKRMGGPGARFVMGDSIYGLTPDHQAIWRNDADRQLIDRWTRVGDRALDILGGVDGGVLAVAPGTRAISRYVHRPPGASAGRWEQIGGPGAEFAADKYLGLFGLTPDRQRVYRWKRGSEWEQVGGPAGTIYPGLATHPTTRDLWRYTGSPMRWERIGGPGSHFTRLAWALNDVIYGLTPHTDGPPMIWHYSGTPLQWRPLGGPARTILATRAGVFATDYFNRSLWYRNHPA
jgi:hypothetical protein